MRVAFATIIVSRCWPLELRFGFTFEIRRTDVHYSFGRLKSTAGNT